MITFDIILTHDELLKMTIEEIKDYFGNMTTIYSLLSTARRRRLDKELRVATINRPCNIKSWTDITVSKEGNLDGI